MTPRRRITPGARARRALVFDLLAAIILAVAVLDLTSGLGVVGFFGLPLFAAGLLWIAAERLRGRTRSRPSHARSGK